MVSSRMYILRKTIRVCCVCRLCLLTAAWCACLTAKHYRDSAFVVYQLACGQGLPQPESPFQIGGFA